MLERVSVKKRQWQAMRVFRLFRLLDELRLSRVPVTAQDLARETGVSLRTLYRDIADLQAMGAPVRGEGGLGYVMERGYFMPSLRLDEDECAALALGVRLVAARADAPMAEAARLAAAKIASAVDEKTRRAFLDSSFEAGPSATARAPHFDALRQAIRNRTQLEIDYLSLTGRASTRRARPLGLTVFDTAWLLTIWCETASDFRHLRVDRIAALRETGASFRDEPGKRFSDCLSHEGRKGPGRPAIHRPRT